MKKLFNCIVISTFAYFISNHAALTAGQTITATKTANPTAQAAGNTIVFTLTINNTNNQDITALLFQDNVKTAGNANLEVASVTTTNLGNPTISFANSNVVFPDGTLASGQQGTVVITAQIPCNAQVNTYTNNAIMNATFTDQSQGFVAAQVQYNVSSTQATLKNVAISSDNQGIVKITGTTDVGNTVSVNNDGLAGTGIVSNNGNFVVTIPAANGTYSDVVVSATNPRTGCTATFTTAVVVGAAHLTNVETVTDCAGNVTITGMTDPDNTVIISGGLSGSAEVDESGEFTATIANVTPGTYTFMVTATNPTSGFSQSVSQTVTVGVSVALSISGETACVGNPITLQATPGLRTYQFFADGNAITGVQQSNITTFTPHAATEFTVTATNAEGCQGTSTPVSVGACGLLSLTNCCSKTIFANSSTSFKITISNTGAVDATNVVVTYQVPSCFTITKPKGTISNSKNTWSFTITPQMLTATIASILAGSTATITIPVSVCCTRNQRLTTTATVVSDTTALLTSVAQIILS